MLLDDHYVRLRLEDRGVRPVSAVHQGGPVPGDQANTAAEAAQLSWR